MSGRCRLTGACLAATANLANSTLLGFESQWTGLQSREAPSYLGMAVGLLIKRSELTPQGKSFVTLADCTSLLSDDINLLSQPESF